MKSTVGCSAYFHHHSKVNNLRIEVIVYIGRPKVHVAVKRCKTKIGSILAVNE
ncbi:hypothetical protein Mapa_006306 [Marchantia paleacea]|nr:hypothetical protein Mapa_006306 [Marchantia paleacea]